MSLKKLMATLSVLVCLLTLIPASGSVKALTLAEIQAQRQELQQKLSDINKKLAAVKDEKELAKEKADTYEERKNIVQSQINVLVESIDIKQGEITVKQEELDKKIREREETYELFKQRLRAMYMSRNTSQLSALLGVSSFSELLVASDTLTKISEHDTDLVTLLEEQQKVIEAEKEVLETELESLETDKAELDIKVNELKELLVEANNDISEAEADETALKEQFDKYATEIAAADAEISNITGGGSYTATYIGGYYAWPVPGYSYISSKFGWRLLYGARNWHGGVDIAGGAIYGKPIIASNTGKVVTAKYTSYGYGNYVILDHGGNQYTVYGHMSSLAVSEGQYVAQGDTIGYVGSTGNSTGPHLHFEIRINGEKVDPLTYIRYGN